MRKGVDVSDPGFPARLQQRREQLGLRVEDVAARADVDKRTVQDCEAGRRKRVLEHTLIGLARALDVDRWWLQYGAPPPDLDPVPPYRPIVPTSSRSRVPLGTRLRQYLRRPVSLGVLVAAVIVVPLLVIGFARHRNGDAHAASPRVEILGDRHVIAGIDPATGKRLWSSKHSGWIVCRQAALWPGEPVAIYGVSGGSEHAEVFARDVRTGDLRWRLPPPSQPAIDAVFGPGELEVRQFVLPDDVSGNGMHYALHFADVDGDAVAELVVVVNHRWDAGACVRIVRTDGSVLGDYWLPGPIGAILATDLDGDGRSEVVVGSSDAGDHGAMLTVLDAAHCRGAAADPAASRRCRLADSARVRIVFPPFAARAMALWGSPNLYCKGLKAWRAADGSARIMADIVPERDEGVMVTLDADLHPLHVEPSDAALIALGRWPQPDRQRFLSGLDDWLHSHRRFTARPLDVPRNDSRTTAPPPLEIGRGQ